MPATIAAAIENQNEDSSPDLRQSTRVTRRLIINNNTDSDNRPNENYTEEDSYAEEEESKKDEHAQSNSNSKEESKTSNMCADMIVKTPKRAC